MRFLMKTSALLLIAFAGIYIIGCSSAEQTTGKLSYQNGEYAKAEIEFLKETQQNSTNGDAWGYLAMSRLMQNKNESAKEAYAQYLKFGNNSLSSEFDKVFNFKFQKGADAFNNAQKSKDSTAAKKLYNDALTEFQGSAVIYPDSSYVLVNTALASEMTGHDDDAAVIYKKILAKDKSDTVSAIRLAYILNNKTPEYLKSQQYQESLDNLKSLSGYNIPKDNYANDLTQYNTAATLLSWGEKMRNDNGDDPAYKDKYQQALPYLEALKNTSHKDLKYLVYNLLVQVYANLGMNKEAEDAMKIRDDLKNNR